MKGKNKEIIARLYEAFGQRDMTMMSTLFDPNIEVRQSSLLPWGGAYKGFKGVVDLATKLLEKVDSQIKVDEFVEAGDQVIAIGWTQGTVRSSGRKFKVRAVHVWTLKKGRVLRFEAYIDTPKMLELLG